MYYIYTIYYSYWDHVFTSQTAQIANLLISNNLV